MEVDNGFSKVRQATTSNGQDDIIPITTGGGIEDSTATTSNGQDDIIPITTGGDIEDSTDENNRFSTVQQTGGSTAGDDIIPISGGGVTNPQDTVGAQVGVAIQGIYAL